MKTYIVKHDGWFNNNIKAIELYDGMTLLSEHIIIVLANNEFEAITKAHLLFCKSISL